MTTAATTLISTVGTSLIYPNLVNLSPDDPDPARAAIATAFARRDAAAVAEGLTQYPPTERLLGAEINSIASLWEKGYLAESPNLLFCHSHTEDGRFLGEVLTAYYHRRSLPVVEACEIEGLQDHDPRQFRTLGLRNLTKQISQSVRNYGADYTAINATGGYKAQIAIAVLMGQALGVPVYYKHERFSEIIAFPPLPVALDFGVWMECSGLLYALDQTGGCLPRREFEEEYSETLASLVNEVEIDGEWHWELSPTGQIFHETFRGRFQALAPKLLPPPAKEKKPPRLEDSGHLKSHSEIRAFLEKVTAEVPQVIRCQTHYYNPDLPGETRFRLSTHGVEGVYSNGSYTVKFYVESTATTPSEQTAVIAALNQWLAERH